MTPILNSTSKFMIAMYFPCNTEIVTFGFSVGHVATSIIFLTQVNSPRGYLVKKKFKKAISTNMMQFCDCTSMNKENPSQSAGCYIMPVLSTLLPKPINFKMLKANLIIHSIRFCSHNMVH